MGKLYPPVYWWYAMLTKIAITIQKINFLPQISKFLDQNSTFSLIAADLSLTGQCFQDKKVPHWFPEVKVPKILPHPLKKRIFCQKRPNLVQNWHFSPNITVTHFHKKIGFLAHKWPNLALNWLFWPNIGIFGPFDSITNQKTMRTWCLCGFSVTWVPKLLLHFVKIWNFDPKTVKFGKKLAFLVIFGQTLAFFSHFVPCPTKKQCEQGVLVVFPLCGYQNLCFLQ